ncbi:hypothetical protein ACS8E9_10665 [Pseudomonas neustonica]|uniref:H-NS histone family protein n=1 Tax=Pseudomonas neustonica TaxID=2487346 RepID=A0ABX9XFD1_9PSED|nr:MULTISPECIES: hypothetical protein [Pseudomonas]MAB23332.1 hypothetical protein [Pseudomonadales bacterium]MBA6420741.1 hypothetical protein [Pseudomonas sp. 5Ae-yellow]ROZ81401.1 hypothetical protein EF099_15010 [Pseudomonas sp. SSM44]ROZ82677.1 hypothetical protein EF096_14340 [Pseudomonas neustonica]|tara:strand:+ start:2356 stop:2547 length:192 start_codon:yes stop_codon:yes gene_type:complete
MSKLSEFRAAERLLADQLAQLESLKQDAGLKEELAFNDELKALMKEYGFNANLVLQILESQSR